MSLLKPIENGRMYPGWWRWNPIGGCEHGCSYCSIKRIEKRAGNDMTTPVFRDGSNGTKNYLNDNLGSGRRIFVCSSGDMWGEWVDSSDIVRVIDHCQEYPDNEYMFLTKDPWRYYRASLVLNSSNFILGATVESDILKMSNLVGDAPGNLIRLCDLKDAKEACPSARIMISIEPVMKFTGKFADRLRAVAPDIVYFGVDSGHNGLPEPSGDELRGLIDEVRGFTKVILKKGIERIVGAEYVAETEVKDG